MNSGGGGLANVPILHSRGYTDAIGDIHDRHRDLTIRARLREGQRPFRQSGDLGRTAAATRQRRTRRSLQRAQRVRSRGALDRYDESSGSTTLAADPAPLSTDKVVKHKPAEAVDACWDATGKRIVERATLRRERQVQHAVSGAQRAAPGRRRAAHQRHHQVSAEADQLSRSYKVSFTDAQKTRMKAVFPTGVCDYSKPGVGQVPFKGSYSALWRRARAERLARRLTGYRNSGYRLGMSF